MTEEMKRVIEESSLKDQWAIECPDCGSLMPDTKAKLRGAEFMFNHLAGMGGEFDELEIGKLWSKIQNSFQWANKMRVYIMGAQRQHSQLTAIYEAKLAEKDAEIQELRQLEEFSTDKSNELVLQNLKLENFLVIAINALKKIKGRDHKLIDCPDAKPGCLVAHLEFGPSALIARETLKKLEGK